MSQPASSRAGPAPAQAPAQPSGMGGMEGMAGMSGGAVMNGKKEEPKK